MLLRINDMRVCYQGREALRIEEPITIEEGDRIGVIGSNGAGKSTLIKSLVGLKSYEGSVDMEIGLRDMAVQMQTNNYLESLPCRAVMERILDMRISDSVRLQTLIDYFAFGDCLKKKYNQLSGGQKQRFTVILVMMQEAKLTFYDEVTSGLDFETRQRLMERLDEWYGGTQDALMIVSHYYEELEHLAEKLLILDQGRVVDFGEKEALFHQYCGMSVVVFAESERTRELAGGFRLLKAPPRSIAVSPSSQEEEIALAERLIRANIAFRRSDCDIELLYLNAKEEKEL